MSLSCRAVKTLLLISSHCGSTAWTLQALFEATHVFSGSILEFSLEGGNKRASETPALHLLWRCLICKLSILVFVSKWVLWIQIFICFFDFLIIADNWLMEKSTCNNDKLVLLSSTSRISTTKQSCGSSRTILTLLCVPVQHQYKHLTYIGSQYFIVPQPWMAPE